MLKKVLIGIVVLGFVGSVGLFLWARSVLAQDTVRTALTWQLSNAIGQPVTIESIGAAIYPRVTVNLRGVKIGNPARVIVQTLQVGTDFRALLSRQIAHATLRLNGAGSSCRCRHSPSAAGPRRRLAVRSRSSRSTPSS